MVATVVVSIVTFLSLIVIILIKPSVKIGKFNLSVYWLAPLVGCLVLLASRLISFSEVWAQLTSDTAVNPLKILVLFISMTMLSIYLDCVGFFSYLASKTLQKAKTSQVKLFVYLYIIVSVLTVFTSNDIIILTFTPFICYFCKRANINPLPYLFGEFVAANTFSMLLIIGNPTNIYLAQSSGIDFLQYLKIMWLPSILGGAVAFIILLGLFYKQLKRPIEPSSVDTCVVNKPMAAIGIAHLAACTVMLVISAYINIEMWLISAVALASLIVCSLIANAILRTKPLEIFGSVKRAPWVLIPFVLSMFVIVTALQKWEVTDAIARALGGGSSEILKYGVVSALAANIMNNIPMSVFFSAVLSSGQGAGAIYATIIGSNIGAYFTPIGALAGIMWMSILKKSDVKMSFAKFSMVGVLVALPVLLVSLGGLYASMALFG